MCKNLTLILAMVGLLFGGTLNAATTYFFSGIITESRDFAFSEDTDFGTNHDRLFDEIAVGSTFTGEFVYDTTVVFSPFSTSTFLAETLSSLTLTVGASTYSTSRSIDSLEMRTDGSEITYLKYLDDEPFLFGDTDFMGIVFNELLSGMGTTVNVLDFPGALPSNLLAGDISIEMGSSHTDPISYDFTSLQGTVTNISVVPLPASFWLLLSGVLALTGLRRTK